MSGLIFVILAPVFLFIFNALTNELCTKKSIPAENQPGVFRTINVLITLLLISAYVENIFTY